MAALEVGVALLVAPVDRHAHQEAEEEGGKGGAEAGHSQRLLGYKVLPRSLVRSCKVTK